MASSRLASIGPDQPVHAREPAFPCLGVPPRREEASRPLEERLEQIGRELLEADERLAREAEELNALNRYLNDILLRMHSGVVAVDRGGLVTSCNPAAERLLGLRVADALGQPHTRVLCNGDGSPSPLAIALATGESCAEVERDVVSGSEKCLRLSSSAAPVRDASGALVGAIVVFTDLTELRGLERRLERADRLITLGELAAEVAHEIRNPLTGMEGFATLLLRDLEPGDPRRAFADHIVAGARSLNAIVSNLLLFCQAPPLQPRPTSVRQTVEAALSFVAEEHGRRAPRDLVIRRDFCPEADALVADPDQLRQALMNLILNALQAMPGGGELRLASRVAPDDPDHTEIHVQDTGPGIPHGVRHKVFDLFFTTKSTGTGLGLAIARRIAALHGGRIDLHSTAGSGTTAVLTLPRQGPAPHSTAPPR